MDPARDSSRASNACSPSRPPRYSFVFCASFAGRSKSLARKASLRAPITAVAAPSPSPVIARTILSSRERKIDEMHALAHELGYFCRPASVWLQDLATRIAMHLKNRLGTMVYQTVGFSMENFPLELAYQTFAMASMQSSTSQGTTTWRMETMDQTNLVFGSIFEEFHEKCVGASKPLQSPSEPVVRVLATIISGAEISHVKLARGVERLYINLMYVLTDEAGTMHFPKDPARNEIAFDPAQIIALRAQVATDAALMGEMGIELSAGWWRQLGNEQAAQMAEAMLDNVNSHPAPPKGKRRRAADSYDIEEIVEVKGKWALVRWAGYALRGRTTPPYPFPISPPCPP